MLVAGRPTDGRPLTVGASPVGTEGRGVVVVDRSKVRSRRLRIVLVVAAVVGVAALAAFEPWRAFTSSTIDEAAPVSADVVQVSGEESRLGPQDEGAPPPASPTAAAEPEPQDVELARGRFEDAEYSTSGLARVLQLADGTRVLRLEGLATSDGPDLHVWLSDQPSGGAWGSYDDDRYVRLGELKATNGNQNYAIPASADLRGMTSVVIWCDRFNVAFGTAPVAL